MAENCPRCGKPTVQDAHFCIYCGSSLAGKKSDRQDWQSKREKVVGNGAHKRTRRWKVLLLAGALAAVGFLVISNLPKGGSPVISSQPVVTDGTSYARAPLPMVDAPSAVEGEYITVPLDAVREKKFIAFAYNGPSGTVPLLAYVSTEGKIVTAISMCEPCNSRRFHIRGNEIICNSCGTKWEIDTLEPISGSCGKYPPDAVPNVVVGNTIRIDKRIVATWQPRV
jgi:uncharacterized Zn finger protein (UPF0148 family)